MDGYLRQFTLDVNAENNHQRIPAKQGDAVNRQLEITLLKDGVAFEPAGVASYAFRCEKPDGTAVVLEGTGSGVPIQAEGSGVYIITLADQCLAVAGRVICDFALVDGDGNILSSSDFILDVPEREAYRVQEYHLPIYHALAMMLEERFYGAGE